MVVCLKATVLLLLLLFQCGHGAVPLSDFFPYGPRAGDQILHKNDDEFSPPIQLSVVFPFFEYSDRTLFVDNNGAISFERGIAEYTPICESLSQDMRMVAPFWADVDTRFLGGAVYYRQTVNDMGVFGKAAAEIGRIFPQFNTIEPRWALIVTWNDVTYFGAETCQSNNNITTPRNTFQVVLTTDGTYSFAIFYYNKVIWTTGTATGGEKCTGLDGTPAKIGFDAGDRKRLFTVPDSCTPEIVDVAQQSNTNSPGKFIFRIDRNEIDAATCNNSQFKNKPLRVSPDFVSMYGHRKIEFSGPCFNESSQISCVFHDPIKGAVTVTGFPIVKKNSDNKVVCQAPFIYTVGEVQIDVIVKEGSTTETYHTSIYVISTEAAHLQKTITLNGEVTTIDLSWNPNFDPNVTVTLDLMMYTIDIGLGQANAQWKEYKTLATGLPNSGKATIKLQTSSIDWNSLKDTIATLALKPVTASNVQLNVIDSVKDWVFSAPIISSYYWAKIFGGQEKKCLDWYKKDPGTTSLDLPPCPPTAALATADPAWELDKGCLRPPCKFHPPPTDHCIRSIQNHNGGGQQCCYSGNGDIVLGPPGGGTEDYCHYKGFNKRCRFPVLSHFKYDVIPWVYCCYEMPIQMCQLYYDKRPSDDGSRYRPPPPAGGRGDPHISTFDLLTYTFNGYGEYWMIKGVHGSTFNMQGRMVQFEDKAATVFVAFVMQNGNGPKVQLQLSSTRHVDTLINDKLIDTSHQELHQIQAPGVDISLNSDFTTVSVNFGPKQMTLLFDVTPQSLSFIANCDAFYKGKTVGLLGVFDGNNETDFTTPDGTKVPIDSSIEDLHYKFGELWRVKSAESIFFYSSGQDYTTFNHGQFVPNFKQPNASSQPPEVQQLCAGSDQCLYDYGTTKSLDLTNQTRRAVTRYAKAENSFKSPPVSWHLCTVPHIDNGASDASTTPTNNTVVKFKCFDGFDISCKTACGFQAKCTCPGNAPCTWLGEIPKCVTANGGSALKSILLLLLFSLLALLLKM